MFKKNNDVSNFKITEPKTLDSIKENSKFQKYEILKKKKKKLYSI